MKIKDFSALIIGASIVVAISILAWAYVHRNQSNNVISVTGMGSQDFKSDLIVWSVQFSRKSHTMVEAYDLLRKDMESIKTYLVSQGIEEKEILFSAVNIQKEYKRVYDGNHNEISSTFDGFLLTQNVNIESKNVEKVEEVSRKITDLINQGIELYSEAPQYYYTKLADLKIEMLKKATLDAKTRAETIAENGGGKLGKLRNSAMGVFQITGQNSNDNYSWDGAYNTYAKNKTATITIKLLYDLK